MAVLKTIGTASRDYATLALFAAYVNVQDLSSTGSITGEMYNDGATEFSLAANVIFGGWTNADITHTVTLTCHAGQSFKDNAGVQTNELRYNVANGVAIKNNGYGYARMIRVEGPWMTVDGLQISCNTAADRSCIEVNSVANCTIQNNILSGISITNDSYAMLVINTTDDTCTAYNNCIIVTSTAGHGIMLNGGTVIGNTIIASQGSTGKGINKFYRTPVVSNNVVAGFTADYFGTVSATSANNATDKVAMGGTNYDGGTPQLSLTAATEWQSVTNGSEDMRLKTGSAKCKDKGATAGLIVDIAGTSRPTGSAYDIGCWEFTTGGGGGSDVLFAQAIM